MFEFKGKLSKEAEDFLYNKQKKLDLISIGIVCGIMVIFDVLLAIIFHPIILLFLFVIACMLVSPFLPVTKKSFFKHMPNRILFNFEEDAVFYESEKLNYSYSISDIDIILDYGSFYHIKFKFIPDSYFVLQKNLIVQGSIIDFEKKFKNKIEKRYE